MLSPKVLEEILRASIEESAEKKISPYWINRLVSVFIEKAGKHEKQKWMSLKDQEHFLSERDFKEEH